MKTIEEIMAIFGGVEGLYVSITNEPYMRLVIEHVGEGPQGRPAISVAHYYELNGDLCQDPEMCFEVDSTPDGLVNHVRKRAKHRHVALGELRKAHPQRTIR